MWSHVELFSPCLAMMQLVMHLSIFNDSGNTGRVTVVVKVATADCLTTKVSYISNQTTFPSTCPLYFFLLLFKTLPVRNACEVLKYNNPWSLADLFYWFTEIVFICISVF